MLDRLDGERKLDEVGKLCLLCGAPLTQNAKGGPKLFCSDRHRASYRAKLLNQALVRMKDTALEASAELARLSAAMEGLASQIEPWLGDQKKKNPK